jgi:hypothetical protein
MHFCVASQHRETGEQEKKPYFQMPNAVALLAQNLLIDLA